MSQNKRQTEMYGENYGARKGGKGSDGASSYRSGSQTDRESNRGIKVYNPPGGISQNVNNSNKQNLKGAKSMPDLSNSRGVKEEGYPPPGRYKNTGISYEYPLNAKQKYNSIAFGTKVPNKNKQQKTIREEPEPQRPVKDKRIPANKGQTPGIVHVDSELSPFENSESPNSTLRSNASKNVGRGRRKSLDNPGSKPTRPGAGAGGPGSGNHKDTLDRKDSAHSTLTGDPYNEDDDEADENFFDE